MRDGFCLCGYPKEYRSNTRLITQDDALCAELYQRIKACCPKTYTHDDTEWEICGLNERFRWCKYIKGQKFDMHCDAIYQRNEKQKSFYTVNIYLNDAGALMSSAVTSAGVRWSRWSDM